MSILLHSEISPGVTLPSVVCVQVEQIQRWLESWDDHFLKAASKAKGKKQNDSGAKKAVLLSGMPGIGKTTSAKVVCHILGFQTIEVFSF